MGKLTVNTKNCKVLVCKENWHYETEFNWEQLGKLQKQGFFIYIINNDGIFYFLNNMAEDGEDFCKIASLPMSFK